MSWKVKCLVCDKSDRIQTTMFGDSGYSNYTVLDDGAIEFKCNNCGTFGSTDNYKDKPNNKIDKFEVSCPNCARTKWSYHIQDVDEESEETHIYCENCKSVWMQK